jgi:thiamine biosynthesis lipoprotein
MTRVLIPRRLSPPPAPARAMIADRLAGETMGTSWSVSLLRPPDLPQDELRRGVQGELDRIVAQMSPWRADSDISRFNRAAADTWLDLPEAFCEVLGFALSLAAESGGAYDPAAGRLVDLWGFGPRDPGAPRRAVPPSAPEIDIARTLSGWYRLAFDPLRRRLRQPGGLHLDLSSVAKGFAVDRVARHLRRSGVPSALVEIGGELRGFGVKPDGTSWWVALEQPPGGVAAQPAMIAPTRVAPTRVALCDLSVATSGDYRRFFETGQRRYSHSLDPRSGWPVDSGLASVTVFHPICMHADALSTLLTVLGPAEGMAYAERHDLAALFLLREAGGGLAERMSAACAAMLD